MQVPAVGREVGNQNVARRQVLAEDQLFRLAETLLVGPRAVGFKAAEVDGLLVGREVDGGVAAPRHYRAGVLLRRHVEEVDLFLILTALAHSVDEHFAVGANVAHAD